MRISWVDNLRWIGILLIVLWHCYLPAWNMLTKYLFSFHVILFFILSWLVFNDKKHTDFIKFVKNKFYRLILPFIFFNVFMFAFLKANWEFPWTRIYDFVVWLSYWDYLWDNGWYMNNKWGFNLINISTWFLTALFITSIYYFLVNKFFAHKKSKIIFMFICSIIIYVYSKVSIFRFPWGFEISFMVMFFYWLAHTYRKQIFEIVEKIDKKHLILLPFILGLNLYFINSTNVSTNYYWNYILLLLNSFLWFSFFTIISKQIGENKLLSFLWKNSIIILWFEWIKYILLRKIDFLSFWFLVNERSYATGFFQFALTILLLIPIIFLINKIVFEFNKILDKINCFLKKM
jgi:fucose 4-O-acetylase-like acetyltransferase